MGDRSDSSPELDRPVEDTSAGAAMAKPAVREPMEKQGFMPRTSTPEELAAYLKDQLAVWNKALKDVGIEPQ